MSHGVMETFSEVVQWEIPDFFALDGVEPEYMESPRFSSAGCKWYMRLRFHPNDSSFNGYVSVYLCRDDPTTDSKMISYTLGLKRTDGNLEEKHTVTNRTFYFYGFHRFLQIKDLKERKSILSSSNTLTITCRIEQPIPERVLWNPEQVDAQETRLMELETLSSDLKDLLISERKCDVTISVQGKEFRAHRAILSARSSVFRDMYGHDTAEDETGLLTISDCDQESFGDFLEFLYTGKMAEPSYRTACHLYVTADKYNVHQFRKLCAGYLIKYINAENVCDLAVLADRHGDDEFMSYAQDFFNDNFCTIFSKVEWEDMMKNNYCLANRLLKNMASAVSKYKS